MVGFYPDVPAAKMALDKDGTQMAWITAAGAITPLTSAEMSSLTGAEIREPNDWMIGPWGTDTNRIVSAVFPEKRDVFGVFTSATGLETANAGYAAGGVWEYSYNTTNGVDGNWSSLVSYYVAPIFGVPKYRTEIKTCTASGVRGVRFRQTSGSYGMNQGSFHVYGYTTAGENPHRLALWKPTTDEEITPAWFDWGDVPRNSSGVKTFRVKNLSPTKTAATARTAMSVAIDGTPANAPMFTLSSDGSTWLSQINHGDIAPGALTGVLTLRRITTTSAQPGLWMLRVFAEATSWS